MKTSKAIGYAAGCVSLAAWVTGSSVCLPLGAALRVAQMVVWVGENQ